MPHRDCENVSDEVSSVGMIKESIYWERQPDVKEVYCWLLRKSRLDKIVILGTQRICESCETAIWQVARLQCNKIRHNYLHQIIVCSDVDCTPETLDIPRFYEVHSGSVHKWQMRAYILWGKVRFFLLHGSSLLNSAAELSDIGYAKHGTDGFMDTHETEWLWVKTSWRYALIQKYQRNDESKQLICTS